MSIKNIISIYFIDLDTAHPVMDVKQCPLQEFISDSK